MNSHLTAFAFRAGAAGLLMAALVAAGGCSKGKAVVSGKITLKSGAPVTAGTVSFWAADNRVGSSAISADGSYSIPDAPVGDVKITVVAPPRRMTMGPASKMPEAPPGLGMPADKMPEGMSKDPLTAPKVVPINERYKDAATTPLQWTVPKGTQEYNITLDP
jgi:hypothetical protein